MKISKSKQELARIISDNGGWRDGAAFSAQDGDGSVGGYGVKPEWDSRSQYWWRDALGYWFHVGKIKNHHQTILSREEYFHLYPEPDADGWIAFNGYNKPDFVDLVVEVTLRDGDVSGDGPQQVDCWDWSIDGSCGDIISYRPHKPEQSKPEYCESVVRSIPEPEAKPSIEQLAADYRNLLDFAQRKQQEADDAKADADAKLKALEIAGEAIGLLVSPITEKQEPELAAVVKVGDEVECVESNIKRDKYNGMVGRLHTIDESDTSTPYLVDFGGNAKIWCHEVKFIRRP